MRGRNSDHWKRELHKRQRNIVFPDTVRNLGTFWRGLRDNELNGIQWVGLVVIFIFYATLFSGLVYGEWRGHSGSFLPRVIETYGVYFLMSIPLILFFLVMIGSFSARK